MEAPGPPAPPKDPGPGLLRGKRSRLQEGEAPDAHVAEEGRRVIREMVARQTDVTLSLQQQQFRERQFTRAAVELPLSRVALGAVSLQQFTAATEAVTRRTELAAMGLSPEDIKLLLEPDDGAKRLSQPERQARAERLLVLQETTSTESQHRDDLASILPADVARAAPGVAGSRGLPHPAFRESTSRLPDHPMQRLHGMERALRPPEEPLAPVPDATSRKRRRMRKVIEKLSAPPPERTSESGSGVGSGSLWDVRSPGSQAGRTQTTSKKTPKNVAERKQYGPHCPKQYTIRDGNIVEVGSIPEHAGPGRPVAGSSKGQAFLIPGAAGADGHVSVENLQSNRLSVEEIRQLPRFTNYEAGTPSSVLYVKNLANTVTEEDLAGVFGGFRKPGAPSLVLRLCNGRMKGQAFITFPDEESAREALSEVNGYQLKERPMIVQYARGQPQT